MISFRLEREHTEGKLPIDIPTDNYGGDACVQFLSKVMDLLTVSCE